MPEGASRKVMVPVEAAGETVAVRVPVDPKRMVEGDAVRVVAVERGWIWMVRAGLVAGRSAASPG